MYALLKTTKTTGIVSEVSRHSTLSAAVSAHDALASGRDVSISAVTADADGDWTVFPADKSGKRRRAQPYRYDDDDSLVPDF